LIDVAILSLLLSPTLMKTRHLVCQSFLFLLSLAVVVGCGAKRPSSAVISGKVTYNGAPVSGGVVTFHSKEGVYVSGISTDGAFNAADLPEGEMIVTIETESVNPAKKQHVYEAKAGAAGGQIAKQYAKAGGAEAAAKGTAIPKGAGKDTKTQSTPGDGAPQAEAAVYVKIPEKYADKKSSPLKVTMHSGSQSQNFELTD
jgi:hypothetical protein